MSSVIVLLSAASGGGRIQEIARTFGVDWPHLIAQAVSFGIVCALLYRFAYHPVLKMLDLRRQRIAEGLSNAEKIKTELAQVEAQRHELMAKANLHAMALIEEARAAAARVGQQETQKAVAAAEQIVGRAREVVARDRDRMLADLKKDVGRLVVQTTAAVIGKVLTSDDQRRLTEETATQLASGSGHSGVNGDERDQTSKTGRQAVVSPLPDERPAQ